MLFMLIPLLALAFLPPAPSMGGGGMLNVPVLACLIGGGAMLNAEYGLAALFSR